MIVVDTNVLAYLYLPTEFTTHAEALLEHDPEWVAPVLWRSEFRSILAGYLRRKTLAFDDARALQAEAESLLAGNEHEVDSQRVLEFVRDTDCSAYDCEFAALALRLDVKLVTMEARLLRAFPKFAVPLTAA
ncbi:MAG TPA: type II toxin-antitoxin system VapC family toxin [Thauera aminoaromatica]|nr:type II toxin-antitoxin system VapC family toxin [Thauera sp.]HMZ30596.1 type II toxin-antitoxin system VapC family toxin [Thauera aminoaromatica]HNC68387.1 type II toxin-antitoxin system VapC family toxin [Thauera aminoaromatica]